MARSDKEERRRFERKTDDEKKVWSKEDREKYEARRAALAPFIRDLMTPPPKKKEKDIFESIFG